MPSRDEDFEELQALITSDGMITRRVALPAAEGVYFKSLLEAYPGMAAIHAQRGRGAQGASTPRGGESTPASITLLLAAAPGFEGELDGWLAELAEEIDLRVLDADQGGHAAQPPAALQLEGTS